MVTKLLFDTRAHKGALALRIDFPNPIFNGLDEIPITLWLFLSAS
jgi:hypothetical protein